MSKRLDHLQTCGRATGAVGSLACSCVWLLCLVANVQGRRRCPSEIQRQIRMREGPCRLVHSLLAAACALFWQSRGKAGARVLQASTASGCQLGYGLTIILAPLPTGQASRTPSSELRDRRRARPSRPPIPRDRLQPPTLKSSISNDLSQISKLRFC